MEDFAVFFVICAVITALVLTPMMLRSRERMRLLELVRSGSERGEPLPPELVRTLMTEPKPQRPSHVRDIRLGIVLIALALAVEIIAFCFYLGGLISEPQDLDDVGEAASIAVAVAGFGAIPLCIGLAFLFLGLAGRKSEVD